MNNSIYGLQYKQGEHSYISVILPMEYLISNSEVLIYGEDKQYGYQRAPKRAHYLKIAKQLLDNNSRSVSTNSIILGINDDELERKFKIINRKACGSHELLEMEVLDSEEIKFRIIDGQHRVKGFQEALKLCDDASRKEEISSFQTNVIIMLLEEKHRLPEVYAFSDINSKAKPLKMDLTILAEYQYLIMEEPEDINVRNYVGTTVIKLLNSGIYSENWKNGIIIDVNASKRIGCVGFKTFLESIEKMCDKKVKDFGLDALPTSFEEKIETLNSISEELARYIGEAWNVVFEKWAVCQESWISEGDEEFITYYNPQYYLQRTMGVFAINKILEECIIDGGGIDKFVYIIKNSTLKLADWNVEGMFAGISSQSGVKKIKQSIVGGSL